MLKVLGSIINIVFIQHPSLEQKADNLARQLYYDVDRSERYEVTYSSLEVSGSCPVASVTWTFINIKFGDHTMPKLIKKIAGEDCDQNGLPDTHEHIEIVVQNGVIGNFPTDNSTPRPRITIRE